MAAPPDGGQLQGQLQELAAQKWRHPVSGDWVIFGRSTIERWYYKALRAKAGPVAALRRKIRSDHGQHPSVKPKLIELLTQQHRAHPRWSYHLHFDNLAVLVEQEPQARPLPSYVSLLRWMKSHGLFKRARRGPVHRPGAQAAERRFEAREIRSYESEYVNGLWHLDFHHGSLRVLLADGQWAYPILLGVLDDHSRLCCHLQWYLAEGARELCHGLSQAFQKRDLPRSILYDNGSAMIAAETEQGLTRLGVLFENTLPYSPYQNGKQETFWGQVEGRLLPMLEGVVDLRLDQLNEATQAWSELEYNREVHSEIGQTVQRASQLASTGPQTQWLVEGLWSEQAVGILGGEPKCCKSFLALDVAVSVASGTACLRQFPVRRSGPVLLFPAEDSLAVVRQRLEGIAAAAQVPFASLPVEVITAPSLRLDTPTDRARLAQTVEKLRPILLILDPLIRLHRVDENDASQIAGLLSYLRELQRQFQLAVLLVHHARKDSHASRPGQAVRGSSELHGWGDSNLYMRRKGSQLTLSTEHRAAPSRDHIPLELVEAGSVVALQVPKMT